MQWNSNEPHAFKPIQQATIAAAAVALLKDHTLTPLSKPAWPLPATLYMGMLAAATGSLGPAKLSHYTPHHTILAAKEAGGFKQPCRQHIGQQHLPGLVIHDHRHLTLLLLCLVLLPAA